MAEKKITPKAAAPKAKTTSGKTAETRQTKKVVKRVARVSHRRGIAP